MSPRRRLRLRAVPVAMLVVATACGSGGDGKPDRPEPEEEQRRATGALVVPADLPGSGVGSVVETEYSTYGKCFGDKPLLGLAATVRTAAAQSAGIELDAKAHVGSAVVLAATAEPTITTFAALSDTGVLSCIHEAFQLIVEQRTGRFVQRMADEVLREPPVGDQSIGYAIDLGALFPVNDAHLGVTVVRAGRGLGFLFTSVVGPERFPEAERVRLASVMAARMPPSG